MQKGSPEMICEWNATRCAISAGRGSSSVEWDFGLSCPGESIGSESKILGEYFAVLITGSALTICLRACVEKKFWVPSL